ncbi:hypothetical protein HZS_2972 [Henneguya salminicola]|nr:hypothetical protein HZS_2972 [Henneguya salminicola]
MYLTSQAHDSDEFEYVYVSEELVFNILDHENCQLEDIKKKELHTKACLEFLHYSSNKSLPVLTLACLFRKKVNDILDKLSSSGNI